MYTDAVAVLSGFTNGDGQIWLDGVQCFGTETRLVDCTAYPLGIHDCAHIEDAGVNCAGILMPERRILYVFLQSYNLWQVVVPKETSDSKKALPLEGVWRSATTISGAQCVMTSGMLLMLKWSADSWDSLEEVVCLFVCLFACLLVCLLLARVSSKNFILGEKLTAMDRGRVWERA